mmetsp:Transcript_45471/g.33245  ORF Transcript_45471/g.33245 Transcript_45471/m.33245 type:complete len:81 (+) Transcript_45471:1500-1742(+)
MRPDTLGSGLVVSAEFYAPESDEGKVAKEVGEANLNLLSTKLEGIYRLETKIAHGKKEANMVENFEHCLAKILSEERKLA